MTERLTVQEIRRLLARAEGKRLQALLDDHATDKRPGVQDAVRKALDREDARRAERTRLRALYAEEGRLRAEGLVWIAGVDEVGRGALAGPLTAGACILPATPRIIGVNDSKQLTPARREELARVIREVAVTWSVAHVEAAEIDALGMTAALRRAMGRAVAGLELEPEAVLVDGRPIGLHSTERAIVGGDAKVAAIAAASILAKVARDELMTSYAAEFPGFGFDRNKGYGSADHLQAIASCGPCRLHRRTFLPGGGCDTLF